MQSRILSQQSKTLLYKPEIPSAPSASNALLRVSTLGPAQPTSYVLKNFQDLVQYKPKLTRRPEEFIGWKTTGTTPIGIPSIPTAEPVSYFDIENNSTYFEVIGGSTYYEVVY